MYEPNLERVISSYVTIHIQGLGGHSSMPSKTHNPILAATMLIHLVSEKVWFSFDSFDNVSLLPISFNAGNRGNIIPETAHILFKAEAATKEQLEKLKVVIGEAERTVEIGQQVKISDLWHQHENE